MTVPTETSRNLYTGNGVTTSFPYTFRVYDAEHIRVWTAVANGNPVELTSGFTVSGVGEEIGGAIVFAEAPTNLLTILIERDVPLLQQSTVPSYGGFDQKTLENTDDRSVMMAQQIAADVARAPLLRKTDVDGQGAYQAGGNRIGGLGNPQDGADAVTLNYMMGVLAQIVVGAGSPFDIPIYTTATEPDPYQESSAMFIRVRDPGEQEVLKFKLIRADTAPRWAVVAVAPYD